MSNQWNQGGWQPPGGYQQPQAPQAPQFNAPQGYPQQAPQQYGPPQPQQNWNPPPGFQQPQGQQGPQQPAFVPDVGMWGKAEHATAGDARGQRFPHPSYNLVEVCGYKSKRGNNPKRPNLMGHRLFIPEFIMIRSNHPQAVPGAVYSAMMDMDDQYEFGAKEANNFWSCVLQPGWKPEQAHAAMMAQTGVGTVLRVRVDTHEIQNSFDQQTGRPRTIGKRTYEIHPEDQAMRGQGQQLAQQMQTAPQQAAPSSQNPYPQGQPTQSPYAPQGSWQPQQPAQPQYAPPNGSEPPAYLQQPQQAPPGYGPPQQGPPQVPPGYAPQAPAPPQGYGPPPGVPAGPTPQGWPGVPQQPYQAPQQAPAAPQGPIPPWQPR